MILKVQDLKVFYGQLEAVAGVSMEIPRGSIVTMLGANGSGKSTVLRAISGLKKPRSGAIEFQGKRIEGQPPHQVVRLGIAQVPEGKRLFPHMSVLENLNFGAYVRRDGAIARDREGILEQFPILKKRLHYKARMLSGGEQQMLAIARALMSKPSLLLMDEPAQGLAPLVIKEIAEIITRLNQTGITILMIEHNVRLALGLAHRVYILDSGRVAFEGGPQDFSEADFTKKVYLGG